MAEHTAMSVLLLSVLVFLFFKYCLGSGVDNNAGLDGPLTLPGNKCPVGQEYSLQRGGCKDIVMSSKSLSERMLLLMPYFLKGAQATPN